MRHIALNRIRGVGRTTGLLLASLMLALSNPAVANHSVLVEGESDFDGDGQVGAAEDSDGDQVFGTINAALSGVSNNGRVTVVTSGRFFEQVTIVANGAVVLEAAPGVDANIEAFNGGGDAAANMARQNQPGVVIDSNGDFHVVVRNIVSLNWTVGFLVRNGSRVTLDGVRADSNVNYGILAIDHARVAVTNSQVQGTGFRRSGTEGVVDADPGVGISFEDRSTGTVTETTVSHSFSAGIADISRDRGRVLLRRNTLFDNRPSVIRSRRGNH